MPKPPSSSAPATTQRTNTVGLKGDALKAFVDSVDQKGSNPADVKREFVRWPFRRESVGITLQQPGGGSVRLAMACRNLSCGGISLFHGSYLHPKTHVMVELPHPSQGTLQVEGTIVRCSHVRGMVHEIGIQFTAPIAARDYVKPDPFSNSFSVEKIDPETLKGTIVYVDDSAAERRLMMHYLRGTALRLRTAEGGEEGLKLLEEGCDLIITDLDMPDMSGPEMVWAMRESGYSTPVVMVTADANAISKLNLVELRVSAFIAKPFSQDIVLRAIAEFISQDSGSRQSCSSLAEDHPNRGLVDTFVAQLREFAKRLVTCMERGDAGACRSIALQVAGSAPNFGFEAIAKLAQAAAKHLASSMSVTESNIPLRSVITACERAKA